MLNFCPSFALKIGARNVASFSKFYGVFGQVQITNSVNLCKTSVKYKLSGIPKSVFLGQRGRGSRAEEVGQEKDEEQEKVST